MSLLLRKNRSLLPSLLSKLYETDSIFRPGIFDFDINFPDNGPVLPDANIIESVKDFQIEIAAPGLDRKDFRVEFENGVLTISAEKEEQQEEKKQNYTRKEFSYNSFSRSFTVPENSLPEKIGAKYENGVLRLTLPKKEVSVSTPKKEIKVS